MFVSTIITPRLNCLSVKLPYAQVRCRIKNKREIGSAVLTIIGHKQTDKQTDLFIEDKGIKTNLLR